MAALRPGQRVLDVACGTGLVTFAAATAVGASGGVVGVDLSAAMVDLARAGAREAGLGHVSVDRMDAEDLRLPAASFDVTLCALGLMYVPDARKAVAEMMRVTRPGGRVAAAVWGQRRRCGWAEIFPIVDARVKSEVCPLFFALGGGSALSAVFTEVGLADVVTERLETTLVWESAEDACGAAFVGGPVALAYSRFDEPTRRAVQDEYLASIEAFRDGSRYRVPGEFVAVAGRTPS